MKLASIFMASAVLLIGNNSSFAGGNESRNFCNEMDFVQLSAVIASNAPNSESEIVLGWQYFAFHANSEPENSITRQVLLRAALDAWIRNQLVSVSLEESGESICEADQLQLVEMMSLIDQNNADWLMSVIKDHGWFHIERFDIALNDAAWLITQHADRRPELQDAVIEIVSASPNELQSRARKYAYLSDRIAIRSGAIQKYATQGRCVASGKWEPWPYANDAEQSRSKIGLPSISSYSTTVGSRCR